MNKYRVSIMIELEIEASNPLVALAYGQDVLAAGGAEVAGRENITVVAAGVNQREPFPMMAAAGDEMMAEVVKAMKKLNKDDKWQGGDDADPVGGA